MESREETIDLRELFTILHKRLWMIISITLVAAIASAIVSFFVLTPIYEAKTELLVNKSEQADKLGMISASDIQSNLQLIDTYNVVITSPRIMDEVAVKLGQPDKTAELTKQIQVSAVKNSQVISITVQDPSQEKAANIANTVATTFQDEIVKLMKVDNVQILTKAKTEEKPSPVKPKPVLNIAIALVVGLMISIGLAFLLEYLDNSLKNEQEVEKHLGLPVLGAISIIEVDVEAAVKQQQKDERKAQVAATGER
ncbi:YveK family protein [Aneurinibacillus tyrosinisolvens]|uniref:YveK family protein n=1 Tax=Aneurinibacillus tyrosinisolvens TaxID=1443435 RepID=UPI00063F4D2A|nr:Wzz/FepE/Etk N-terminal domain-containing protein [Aneurinibacillus tyrosinisolvens]